MKPVIRFSAVRGTASPVNGFSPRITVSRWKPGTAWACSLSHPSSASLMSSRTFSDHRRGEVADPLHEAERALAPAPRGS